MPGYEASQEHLVVNYSKRFRFYTALAWRKNKQRMKEQNCTLPSCHIFSPLRNTLHYKHLRSKLSSEHCCCHGVHHFCTAHLCLQLWMVHRLQQKQHVVYWWWYTEINHSHYLLPCTISVWLYFSCSLFWSMDGGWQRFPSLIIFKAMPENLQ